MTCSRSRTRRRDAIAAIRGGGGPRFLLARTYRLTGHTASDAAAYRPAGRWRRGASGDPIARAAGWLAAGRARGSRAGRRPARGGGGDGGGVRGGTRGTFPEAAEAFRDVQDAGAPGSILMPHELPGRRAAGADRGDAARRLGLGARRGSRPRRRVRHISRACDEFGPERISDAPISEAAIMGVAVGAAMMGTRPVAEMRFSDFALCAIDELVNQAAKARFMFGGQARVPLVARDADRHVAHPRPHSTRSRWRRGTRTSPAWWWCARRRPPTTRGC